MDRGKILAFIPSVEPILVNDGNFLYPAPPKLSLTSSIPPLAVDDLVVYFKLDVFDCEYARDSGTLPREILNVVAPIPKTLYLPL